MTRSSNKPLEEPDLEIERILSNIRKIKAYLKEVVKAEDKGVGKNVPLRLLKDYATPSLDITIFSIWSRRLLQPNLKSNRRPSLWFNKWHALEDPSLYLATFVEICNTFKCNGLTEDVIRLLFPFSLKDMTELVDLFTAGSITTWDQLTQKFLAKYFLYGKTLNIREKITLFFQGEFENLQKDWAVESMSSSWIAWMVANSDIL